MTCAALIGDLENGSPDEQQMEQKLRAMIELENISAFVFGYFGPFEQLALRVIQRLQKEYPLLDYTVMLTGRWQECPDVPELDYCPDRQRSAPRCYFADPERHRHAEPFFPVLCRKPADRSL